jgi:hypothetical protein
MRANQAPAASFDSRFEALPGLVFLSGVVIRILAPEYHVTRVGDVLMAVGFLAVCGFMFVVLVAIEFH